MLKRTILLTTLALLGSAQTASARRVVWGLGEQKPAGVAMMAAQWHVKRSRYITPWNSVWANPGQLDAWMQTAHRAGIDPIIAFEHRAGQEGKDKAPSIKEYRRAVRIFRRRYPWVHIFSAWNEPNFWWQPAAIHNPKVAAGYYRALRAECRRCTITAGDLAPQGAKEVSWLKTYRRYLGERPKVWAYHGYADWNRRQPTQTIALRRLADRDRAQLWMTEGAAFWADNERKQAAVAKYGRALSEKYVDRAYYYNFIGTQGQAWDSALLDYTGHQRLAARVFSGLFRR